MLTQIQKCLPKDHPWRDQILYLDATDSTNDQAKKLIAQGAPHGTVIIADRQTAGRGRLGRSFSSPAGMGVYMSVILRLKQTPDQLMHLTCASAVAACDAVEKAAKFRLGIKWTNDLVFGGRKLAGILTELVIQNGETAAIIGIGVNCAQTEADFPPEIQSFAGSLSMACGHDVSRSEVAAALIEAFAKTASNLQKKQALLDTYRRDCITLDKQISLQKSGEIRHGYARDIDGSGALIVEFSDGHTEAVNAGEVSVRGMYGYCP